MILRPLTIGAVSALLLLLAAGPAVAGEDEAVPLETPGVEAPEPWPPKPWVFEVNLGYGHLFTADFDDSPGSVSTDRFLFQFGATHFLDKKTMLGLNLHVFDSHFDFDGNVDLVPGTSDPFTRLRTARIGGLWRRQESEEFSWFGGLSLESSGERDADFSDTLAVIGFGAANWKLSKSLELGVGAIFTTRLEASPLFIPVPFFDWRIDDRWRLRSEARLDRVRFILSYALSDDLDLGIEGGYFGQRYRLDDDGPLPGGVFHEQRFPAAISAEWRISRQWVLAGYAGLVVLSSFRFEDSGGDRVGSDDLEPAPLFGISLVFRF